MVAIETSELDIKAETLRLVVGFDNGIQSQGTVKLTELDKLIVDLHKIRLGLVLATKTEIGVEIATKKKLEVEEKKIRSILVGDFEAAEVKA